MADSQVAKVDAAAARVVSASGRQGPPAAEVARRRTAAAKQSERVGSPRAAGAGGSTPTMMRLYTNDDTPGLRVDPLVVLVLAVVFIFSVVGLHLLHKVIRFFTK